MQQHYKHKTIIKSNQETGSDPSVFVSRSWVTVPIKRIKANKQNITKSYQSKFTNIINTTEL